MLHKEEKNKNTIISDIDDNIFSMYVDPAGIHVGRLIPKFQLLYNVPFIR